jgi:hypothetical protein
MPEKDPERAQRLNEVYKHLFAFYDVASKTEFAKILGIQRTGLAAAFGGNKANLTDSLFKNICKTFPGVFNLDYLLTGNGDLLTIEEDVKTEDIMKSAGGYSSPTNNSDAAFMMSKNFEVMLKPILDAHDKLVANLEKQIADKDAQIQQQADIIASLQKVIDNLRSMSSSADIEKYIRNNPFPVGVADKSESPRAEV